MAQQQEQVDVAPKQEGSRWRFTRPSSEEVATWFTSVPLDDDMNHSDFVSGVVLIPATETVKYQTRTGTAERKEMTFTPYMRVDTRIAYFHKLAEAKKLIPVIEPVAVPQVTSGAGKNDHMPEGYWWHVIGTETQNTKFLCCTMRVALYREEDYFSLDRPEEVKGSSRPLRPVRFGVSTKQIKGLADDNMLAKAETGAIGRALGVAGILVVGTGIATAEDMAEMGSSPLVGAPTLPEIEEAESDEQLNERLLALQTKMQQDVPEKWSEFSAWWTERKGAEGWSTLYDAPYEARRGMATRMEGMIETGIENRKNTVAEPAQDDSPEQEPKGDTAAT